MLNGYVDPNKMPPPPGSQPSPDLCHFPSEMISSRADRVTILNSIPVPVLSSRPIVTEGVRFRPELTSRVSRLLSGTLGEENFSLASGLSLRDASSSRELIVFVFCVTIHHFLHLGSGWDPLVRGPMIIVRLDNALARAGIRRGKGRNQQMES